MSLIPRGIAFASLYASGRAVLRAQAPAVHACDALPGSRRWKSYKEKELEKERELPRGDKIPFDHVRVVDPDTGKLGELEPLAALLARINKKEVMVQSMVRDQPIVRLLDRHEEHQKKKDARAKERANATRPRKTIQFTYGISAADLEHKLKKARQELEKRSPIDIQISFKRNQEIDKDARATMAETCKSRLADLAIFRKMDAVPGRTVLEFDLDPAAFKK